LQSKLLFYTMVSTSSVQVRDLSFVPFIGHSVILARIRELGAEINKKYDGLTPVFVPVLNGAFMFASDLLKEVCVPSEVSFVKVSSYFGATSSGDVKEILGLQSDIKGRHVIVVEDIIDTGLTMSKLLETFKAHGPASIAVAALFVKPESLKVEVQIDYIGFNIENKFIVGYGLDYKSQGRNYPDVYQLAD